MPSVTDNTDPKKATHKAPAVAKANPFTAEAAKDGVAASRPTQSAPPVIAFTALGAVGGDAGAAAALSDFAALAATFAGTKPNGEVAGYLVASLPSLSGSAGKGVWSQPLVHETLALAAALHAGKLAHLPAHLRDRISARFSLLAQSAALQVASAQALAARMSPAQQQALAQVSPHVQRAFENVGKWLKRAPNGEFLHPLPGRIAALTQRQDDAPGQQSSDMQGAAEEFPIVSAQPIEIPSPHLVALEQAVATPSFAGMDVDEMVQVVMMNVANQNNQSLEDVCKDLQANMAKKDAVRAYTEAEQKAEADVKSQLQALYNQECTSGAVNPSITSFDQFCQTQKVVQVGQVSVDADGIPHGTPVYAISPNLATFPQTPPPVPNDPPAANGNSSTGGAGQTAPPPNSSAIQSQYGLSAANAQALIQQWQSFSPSQQDYYANGISDWLKDAQYGPGLTAGSNGDAKAQAYLGPAQANASITKYQLSPNDGAALLQYYNALSPKPALDFDSWLASPSPGGPGFVAGQANNATAFFMFPLAMASINGAAPVHDSAGNNMSEDGWSNQYEGLASQVDAFAGTIPVPPNIDDLLKQYYVALAQDAWNADHTGQTVPHSTLTSVAALQELNAAIGQLQPPQNQALVKEYVQLRLALAQKDETHISAYGTGYGETDKNGKQYNFFASTFNGNFFPGQAGQDGYQLNAADHGALAGLLTNDLATGTFGTPATVSSAAWQIAVQYDGGTGFTLPPSVPAPPSNSDFISSQFGISPSNYRALLAEWNSFTPAQKANYLPGASDQDQFTAWLADPKYGPGLGGSTTGADAKASAYLDVVGASAKYGISGTDVSALKSYYDTITPAPSGGFGAWLASSAGPNLSTTASNANAVKIFFTAVDSGNNYASLLSQVTNQMSDSVNDQHWTDIHNGLESQIEAFGNGLGIDLTVLNNQLQQYYYSMGQAAMLTSLHEGGAVPSLDLGGILKNLTPAQQAEVKEYVTLRLTLAMDDEKHMGHGQNNRDYNFGKGANNFFTLDQHYQEDMDAYTLPDSKGNQQPMKADFHNQMCAYLDQALTDGFGAPATPPTSDQESVASQYLNGTFSGSVLPPDAPAPGSTVDAVTQIAPVQDADNNTTPATSSNAPTLSISGNAPAYQPVQMARSNAVVSPLLRAALQNSQAGNNTSGAGGGGAAPVDVAGEMTVGDIDADVQNWQGMQDTFGDMSQQIQIRVQLYQNQAEQAYQMLSNIMKKLSDTRDGIIANMKT